jgi:hypothetical protein
MNQNHQPTLRIHGPVDLLSAVPYLLGFHPIESLVLIGLTHGVLVVTARLDLADAVEHDVLIAETLEAMLRGGSTQFLAAIFSDDPPATKPATQEGMPHADLALTVAALIDKAGGELLDALLVTNGVWTSYLCADPRCCPPSGRMLPDAPTPFAAAATVAGLTVAPSRRDLELRFEPDHDRRLPLEVVEQEECRLGPVIVNGKLGLRGDIAVRAIRHAMKMASIGGYIEQLDIDIARLGAAPRHHAVRDAIWSAIDNDGYDADELWLDLARRLPSPYDAAPLFLYGWSAWRHGNGTLAGMAAERALAADPDYSAAQLLLAAVRRVIDPRAMRKLCATYSDTQPGPA